MQCITLHNKSQSRQFRYLVLFRLLKFLDGFYFYFLFFYSEKSRLNSPRANKRAQIKLQNNTEYYGLNRMSLRVDFRNDKDWVSLGAGGRVFHREMADGKKDFWKDEVLEGGQRKLLG